MVLTAYVVLSPVTGLFCHRHSQSEVLSLPGWAKQNSANLTPASGRQDHTILPSAKSVSRQRAVDRSRIPENPPCDPIARKTLPRPPHPHPASVTIAIRPSGGVGWREFVEMICPTGEVKYFCKGDWTTQITLIRFNNFRCARTTMPSSLRENLGIASLQQSPLHGHAEFIAHDSRLQFRSLNHVRRGAANGSESTSAFGGIADMAGLADGRRRRE
jgi:hypothetical protein